jgi:anti-sigma-K factor RskA
MSDSPLVGMIRDALHDQLDLARLENHPARTDLVAMTATNKQPGRHKIEKLLPWHATGTLSSRDADRVEQALAGDRELARRYELVRQELAETTRLNETLGPPSARAMEKLFAAINAEEARAPRRRRRRMRF